jgi:diguanylate cyclase (GGDEF)-like protein
LQIFADETALLVAFDAISFSREDGSIGYATAPQARHKANYRLEVAGIYLGDICFSRRTAFSNGELVRLEAALSTLGFPLRNALLYREAINAARIDALTQIGNRHALNQALQTEMVIAERYQQPFSLLIIDIDHFKAINDDHGHLVGDQVLRAVAKNLQDKLRRSDTVYRYGGEEFVVLLRNTDVNGAAFIAERLRQAVECAAVRGSQGAISVTISTGIAAFEHGTSQTALLDRADKALYQAKQSGRNRVCTAA